LNVVSQHSFGHIVWLVRDHVQVVLTHHHANMQRDVPHGSVALTLLLRAFDPL
jgi:hypothetical protein